MLQNNNFLSEISDNTKNNYMVMSSKILLFFFLFLKSQFFRSAGNVIQQIKKPRLTQQKQTTHFFPFIIILFG